jgi:hypothetical protein
MSFIVPIISIGSHLNLPWKGAGEGLLGLVDFEHATVTAKAVVSHAAVTPPRAPLACLKRVIRIELQ